MLLSFFHTCASKQHHDLHDREFLVLPLSYTTGNFSLQNLACIFLQWASSNALGLHEQASWMHTHLVFSLSFHTLIALSASVAWQSLLLALTSIDGHLHSTLISRVDVRLSPFCLLHTTSTIIFYSTYSVMSMAHTHVLRES